MNQVREWKNEMVTGTWNVLSLHQSRSLRILKDELKAKRSVGRPRRRWLDNAKNDQKKYGFIGTSLMQIV